MLDPMSKRTEEPTDDARKIDQAIAYAKLRGDRCFTSENLARYLHERRAIAIRLIKVMIRDGHVRPSGLMKRNEKRTSVIPEYVFIETGRTMPEAVVPSQAYNTLREHIDAVGDDEGFEPTSDAVSSGTLTGSQSRVEVYRSRVQKGQEIFNDTDAADGVARYGVEGDGRFNLK